jgi:hypothetical protein
MKTREFSRILLALAAALLLADCSGGNGYTSGGTPIFASGPTYYVSNSGDDTFTGTSPSLAFKTITHALSVAASGSAVSVAPGIYNAPNEAFPLMVPDGVQLIGDEVYKGLGFGLSPHTTISGGGASVVVATVGAAIVPGNRSTVAGFEITNTISASGNFPSGIVLKNGIATIRNNTVTGSTSFGIYVAAAGADLGGGSAGSTGGNSIFCNMAADVIVAAGISVSAKNNFWDHLSPTQVTAGGACTPAGTDFCPGSGSTIDATGAQVAPGACL